MTLSIGSRVPSTTLGAGFLVTVRQQDWRPTPSIYIPNQSGSQRVPSTKLGTGLLVGCYARLCPAATLRLRSGQELAVYPIFGISWVGYKPLQRTKARLSSKASLLSVIAPSYWNLDRTFLPHVAGLGNTAYSCVLKTGSISPIPIIGFPGATIELPDF